MKKIFVCIGVFLSVIFLFSDVVHAEKTNKGYSFIWGKVTQIYDGDTIAIRDDNGKSFRVQLAYIDAPDEDTKTGEKQPLHRESLNTLSKMIAGKEVIIESTGKDKFNRIQGLIFLDKLNVNLEMVRLGMAEIYHPVRANLNLLGKVYREDFISAEKYAQRAKQGVWALENYVSPYKFRRRNK